MRKISPKPNTIYKGDALSILKKLPDGCVDMVMTSPPYWALRDYGVKGQLGLEPHFENYINNLCGIFDEVKRVIKDTGTCWANLGDTYSGSGCGSNGYRTEASRSFQVKDKRANLYKTSGLAQKIKSVPAKSLVGIPFRFTIEMVSRGWILRNVVIWHKPNCMPSSAKDRFTVDFEYLFFFSKSPKYFFETQREPHKESSLERTKHSWKGHREPMSAYAGMDISKMCHPQGRNKRTVWKIPTNSFSEAHFAVYPPKLCETPICAGCPDKVCKCCGTPYLVRRSGGSPNAFNLRVRDVKAGRIKYSDRKASASEVERYNEQSFVPKVTEKVIFNCDCNAGFSAGIVLDPFFGAGTTGLVALQQSKQFIGIELNLEYIKIARKRLRPYLKNSK